MLKWNLRRAVLITSALALATLTTGATARNAAACANGNCEMRCYCDGQCNQNYEVGTQAWFSCRESCHYNYPCDIEYLCP